MNRNKTFFLISRAAMVSGFLLAAYCSAGHCRDLQDEYSSSQQVSEVFEKKSEGVSLSVQTNRFSSATQENTSNAKKNDTLEPARPLPKPWPKTWNLQRNSSSSTMAAKVSQYAPWVALLALGGGLVGGYFQDLNLADRQVRGPRVLRGRVHAYARHRPQESRHRGFLDGRSRYRSVTELTAIGGSSGASCASELAEKV